MTPRGCTIIQPRDEIEDAYLALMNAEGRSNETVRQRIYVLRGLGARADEATHDDVVRLLTERQLSKHTQASYITVLKTVFGDLMRLGLVEHDPTARLKVPRTPRRMPRPLPPDELERLLHMPSEMQRSWTVLGAFAGLRAGEVARITGTALRDGLHGPVIRITGKGGLVADIPAHPRVVAVLEPFYGDPEPIWPMWPKSINRSWQRAAAEVGVHDRVFHQLRHSYATRLAQSGVPILVVAEACRHASVATTQRYAQVADGAAYAAVASL